MNILVCLGGIKEDVTEVALAGKIALSLGAELTLLYVKPETYYGHKRLGFPKEEKSSEDILKNAESSLKREGVYEVRTVVRSGNPVEEILKESEKGYDLVITGRRELRVTAQFLLESVSREVAMYADVPVFVVKKDILPKKILICTDGSEYSTQAEYCGGYLARKFKAGATLFAVAPVEELVPYARESLEKGKKILKEVFEIEPGTKLRSDDVVESIVGESKDYDLVVLGSRGLSKIKRLLMGHVSLLVLEEAGTNVLIVRKCPFFREEEGSLD
jgi:nucleotide-binding universal stress UspA family protein